MSITSTKISRDSGGENNLPQAIRQKIKESIESGYSLSNRRRYIINEYTYQIDTLLNELKRRKEFNNQVLAHEIRRQLRRVVALLDKKILSTEIEQVEPFLQDLIMVANKVNVLVSAEVIYTFRSHHFPPLEQPDYWDVMIYISHSVESKTFYTTALLIDILNHLEGVTVKIKRVREGSLRTWFRVIFRNQKARELTEKVFEETKEFVQNKIKPKEFLEDTIEGAKNYTLGNLNKEHLENQKRIAETDNIKVQTSRLEQSNEIENSISFNERSEFLKRAMEADVVRKELENELLKMDLLDKQANFIKEHLGNEIVASNMFRAKIGNTLQINFENSSDQGTQPNNDI